MIFASRLGGITARSEELPVCGEESLGTIRFRGVAGFPKMDELSIGNSIGHNPPCKDRMPDRRKAGLEVEHRIPRLRTPTEMEDPVAAILRPAADEMIHGFRRAIGDVFVPRPPEIIFDVTAHFGEESRGCHPLL